MAKHHELTEPNAIHPAAFVGAADPAATPSNNVTADKLWVDTTLPAPYVLKKRDATNTVWEVVGAAGGGPGTMGPPGVIGPPGLDAEEPEMPYIIPGGPGPTGLAGAAGSAGAAVTVGPPGMDAEEPEFPYIIPGSPGAAGAAGSPGSAGAAGPPGLMGPPGLDAEEPELPYISLGASVAPITFPIQGYFDGGGSAIANNSIVYVRVPTACVIVAWSIVVDTGTITIDVLGIANSDGGALPTASITAAAVPAIAAGNQHYSTTLTSWGISRGALDVLAFKVTAISGATKAAIALICTKS